MGLVLRVAKLDHSQPQNLRGHSKQKEDKKMAKIVSAKMDMGRALVTYDTGKSRSYDVKNLPKTVKAFLADKPEPEMVEEGGLGRESEWVDPFFKDESAKVCFYLLEMAGEARTDFLGITPSLYRNKELAKEWAIALGSKIDDSTAIGIRAKRELDRIFDRMTQVAK